MIRWQPLEGMLAMLISLSDDIGSVLEADKNAGRPPTIALGQLHSEVVASILNDSSQYRFPCCDMPAVLN